MMVEMRSRVMGEHVAAGSDDEMVKLDEDDDLWWMRKRSCEDAAPERLSWW